MGGKIIDRRAYSILMDNNASKNTNSHKFFKLWFNYEKPAISLKNLLKQELLSVLNLYLQSINFKLNSESLGTLIDRQLNLLSLDRQRSLLERRNAPERCCIAHEENFHKRAVSLLQNNNGHLFDMGSIPLCYSCPIGLILAPRLQISPKKVVEDLGNLLARHSSNIESNLLLYLDTDPTGWLNFYVTERAIGNWLERSLWLFKTQAQNNSPLTSSQSDRCQKSDFSVQYIHARCCSLLRLGAREKLITLIDNNFNYAVWQLTQPRSISWLDRQHHLWFERQSEYNLLRQLLIVTDSQTVNDRDRWSKLALDLSQVTAIFLADCRFLGEIKEQYPKRAIARLGLIALAQCWLQKILVEKLNCSAPTTL